MQRGAKIALASGIVLSGLAAASLFRKPPNAATPPDADAAPLERSLSSLLSHDPTAAAQLSDQIDPVDSSDGPRAQAANDEQHSTSAAHVATEPKAAAAPAPQAVGVAGASFGGRAQMPSPRRRTHRVRDGDTLSSLARDYLGSSKRFLEIYEANRDVLQNPELLPIGVELKLPWPDEVALQPATEVKVERTLAPLSPRPAPAAPAGVKRTYRVQAGDTLVAIAKQFYGNGERYLEIYEANRERLQEPDDLREGLLLDIP